MLSGSRNSSLMSKDFYLNAVTFQEKSIDDFLKSPSLSRPAAGIIYKFSTFSSIILIFTAEFIEALNVIFNSPSAEISLILALTILCSVLDVLFYKSSLISKFFEEFTKSLAIYSILDKY